MPASLPLNPVPNSLSQDRCRRPSKHHAKQRRRLYRTSRFRVKHVHALFFARPENPPTRRMTTISLPALAIGPRPVPSSFRIGRRSDAPCRSTLPPFGTASRRERHLIETALPRQAPSRPFRVFPLHPLHPPKRPGKTPFIAMTRGYRRLPRSPRRAIRRSRRPDGAGTRTREPPRLRRRSKGGNARTSARRWGNPRNT